MSRAVSEQRREPQDTASVRRVGCKPSLDPFGPRLRTIFSPCRTYRYSLWRDWIGGDGYAMFIGLNPSTADEVIDDPTVRRCQRFAQTWGYSALCVTNLFAFRATDPAVMKAAADPVGPDTDRYLVDLAASASLIIAAWGVHGNFQGRADVVRAMLPELHCLQLTKDGSPAHPLYLPRTLQPVLLGSNA